MDLDAAAPDPRPAPEAPARGTERRALPVALGLIACHDDLGDREGWNEGIRSMLGTFASAS
jgi:hypothetical protein